MMNKPAGWRGVLLPLISGLMLAATLGMALGFSWEPALGALATGIRLEHAPAGLTDSGATSAADAPVGPTKPSEATNHTLYLPTVSREILLGTRIGYATTSDAMARAASGDPAASDLLAMRAGWYLNWTTWEQPPRPQGMEYAQMIRLHQDLTCPIGTNPDRETCPYVVPHSYTYWPDAATIQRIAQTNPGSLWLIGNEIDRRDWYGAHQDEILPELYAEAYHELYNLVKAADPTAKVAIGGVVQMTPLRMLYLDRVWNAYLAKYGEPMPVDVWNMHVFVLPERRNSWGADIPAGIDAEFGAYRFRTDESGTALTPMPEHIQLQYVEEQVLRFRTWLKEKGEQEKPVIITEYGVLLHNWMMGFPDEDPQPVVNYMLQTFDYFLNARDCSLGYTWDDCRLVQRWVWFSLDWAPHLPGTSTSMPACWIRPPWSSRRPAWPFEIG